MSSLKFVNHLRAIERAEREMRQEAKRDEEHLERLAARLSGIDRSSWLSLCEQHAREIQSFLAAPAEVRLEKAWEMDIDLLRLAASQAVRQALHLMHAAEELHDAQHRRKMVKLAVRRARQLADRLNEVPLLDYDDEPLKFHR